MSYPKRYKLLNMWKETDTVPEYRPHAAFVAGINAAREAATHGGTPQLAPIDLDGLGFWMITYLSFGETHNQAEADAAWAKLKEDCGNHYWQRDRAIRWANA